MARELIGLYQTAARGKIRVIGLVCEGRSQIVWLRERSKFRGWQRTQNVADLLTAERATRGIMVCCVVSFQLTFHSKAKAYY